MEEQIFTVIIDNISTFNLSINKLQTIKSIKDFLNNKYAGYNIKMYINDHTKLKVFNNSKYDDRNLESVWNEIDNGRIEITLLEKRNETKTQSVKVSKLRKVYGNDINLHKWLLNPQNVYVGRRGRIFIDGEIFYYPGSQWANPFKRSDYTLEESLKLYRNHLEEKGLLTYDKLIELKGKTLGCFCETASTTPSNKLDCHTKVLYQEILKHCP